MKDFYVYWSVYDHERETSLPLYRAILRGRNQASVTSLAKRMTPRVVRHHNAQDAWFRVDHVSEVETFVQPLDEWSDRLLELGDKLQEMPRGDE